MGCGRANGANDIQAGMRLHTSTVWEYGSLVLQPFGGPGLAKRRLDGGELIWDHSVIGMARMNRFCCVPQASESLD